MIKNPKLGQTVFFLEELRVKKSTVFFFNKKTKLVNLNSYHWLFPEEIFPTEQSAIQHALKIYNKKIQTLTKKREKLASRLAEILG